MKYKNVQHELKPFYDYTEEEAKDYEYYSDFMYLMNSRRAEQLYNLGLPIYVIYPDCCQIRVKDLTEFKEKQFVCGIEKSAWQEFLHTEKGAMFVWAWNEVSSIAQCVRNNLEINKDIFTDEYYEDLYLDETNQMENYFDERYKYLGELPKHLKNARKNIRVYIPLLFEYAERLNDAFKKAGAKCFNTEDIFTELVARYVLMH